MRTQAAHKLLAKEMELDLVAHELEKLREQRQATQAASDNDLENTVQQQKKLLQGHADEILKLQKQVRERDEKVSRLNIGSKEPEEVPPWLSHPVASHASLLVTQPPTHHNASIMISFPHTTTGDAAGFDRATCHCERANFTCQPSGSARAVPLGKECPSCQHAGQLEVSARQHGPYVLLQRRHG